MTSLRFYKKHKYCFQGQTCQCWFSFCCVLLSVYSKSTCFWETRPHHPTAGTHTSSFLLKLCSFLSVGYGPLHKAHRLVHVAFDSIDHSTLTKCIAPGAAESHIKEYIKTEKERERQKEKQAPQLCGWHGFWREVQGVLKVTKQFFKNSDAAVKKEESRKKKSHTESRGAVYLPCFGLVLNSLFGLFLSHCNVVHWLGHVLLYVVYYITLEKKQQWSKAAHLSSINTALHSLHCLNTKTNVHVKRHSAFPWRDANNTNSRTTPLPQTQLSLRKHGASSNKHVVRLREWPVVSVCLHGL